MRLHEEQRRLIVDTSRRMLGDAVHVTLFGSRVDDRAKGGDVDLYVEVSSSPGLWEQARLAAALEQGLGLPVDLVVRSPKEPEGPLHRLAKLTGVPLA